MEKCPVCGVSVKLENLEKHVTNQHPKADVDFDEIIGETERKELRSKARSRGARPTVSRRGIQVAAIVVVLLLIIIAFVTLNPFRPVGPQEGQFAPDFSLTSTDGVPFRLSDFQGVTPVLLEFMDIDCPACQHEADNVMPFVHENYSGRVRFISVDVNFVGETDTDGRINGFKVQHGTTWTYALDASGSVRTTYGIFSTPTSLVVDRDGLITRRFEQGLPTVADFAAELDAVLGG